MVEEEKYILSCLITNERFIERLNLFKADFFSSEIARKIFVCIVSQNCRDILEIQKKAGLNDELDLLIELSSYIIIPNEMIFDVYLMKIFEEWKSKQRELLLDSYGYTSEAVEKLIELDEIKLYSSNEENACEELLKKVEMKFTGKGNPSIVATGFKSVDNMIEGFDKGELIFIAGSSGSGKTTLAINIAYNIAKGKKKVLFFSLEMREVELYERLVKNIAEVGDFTKMTQEKFDKVVRIARAMKERLTLVIQDKNLSFEDMIIDMKREKPDLVIIDHLNILTSSESFRDNLMRLEYLTRRMKETAKDIKIPIVCLCQLNRSNADRETKRPTLSDLRGSGSIEQDANIVIGVYRPEYFLLQSKPDEDSKSYEKWEEQMRKYKDKAEVLVMKNRRGRTGSCEMIFEGEYYRFAEVDDD